MAMGAVLSSSRAFASPLSPTSSAGKQHEMKYSTSPHTSRWVCSLVPGERNGRPITISIETARQLSSQIQQPLPNSLTVARFCNASPKRRLLSRVDCFLSSDPVTSGWHKPMRRENLTGSDSACVLQPEYRVPVRKRADCKAEQYEMTGSSSDVPADTVLAGEVSSWWQQFPMDRVNMSIAILPMSAEFGWSPATVGLIQSSFFWGYLLTQILGGIWTDRFGGKVVLGFGVVWWSIATMLTPITAKLGLPFLLDGA